MRLNFFLITFAQTCMVAFNCERWGNYRPNMEHLACSGILEHSMGVSHQWCDLFHRLLHSHTRHIERVVRGERDIVLGAQEWGHGDVAQGDCVSQATQAEWRYQGTSPPHTVIRFLWVSAKFSTCTVVRVNETLTEDKMRRFKGECEHFRFNKCLIYTHDGVSAKFSTISQEMDNSAIVHLHGPLFRDPRVTRLNSDSFCDSVQTWMEVIGHF
jgi:hypothetical protein